MIYHMKVWCFKIMLNFRLGISFIEGRRQPFTEYLNKLLKRPDVCSLPANPNLRQNLWPESLKIVC